MCIRLKRPVLNPQGLPEGFTNKPHFGVFTKQSAKRQQLLCMEGAISSRVLGIPKAKNMICDANISHKIWLKNISGNFPGAAPQRRLVSKQKYLKFEFYFDFIKLSI